jgi:hypothetical protein
MGEGQTDCREKERGLGGHVVFAGTILLVIGSINFFDGLIVLFND